MQAVREAAAETLGRQGATAAISQLTAALDDPVWQVRLKAIRSLGQLGARQSALAIATGLLQFSSRSARDTPSIAASRDENARAVAAGAADTGVLVMRRASKRFNRVGRLQIRHDTDCGNSNVRIWIAQGGECCRQAGVNLNG